MNWKEILILGIIELYLKQWKNDIAIKILEEHINQDKNNYIWYQELSRIKFNEKQYDESMKNAKIALSLNSDKAITSWYILWKIYYNFWEFKKAKIFFDSTNDKIVDTDVLRDKAWTDILIAWMEKNKLLQKQAYYLLRRALNISLAKNDKEDIRRSFEEVLLYFIYINDKKQGKLFLKDNKELVIQNLDLITKHGTFFE